MSREEGEVLEAVFQDFGALTQFLADATTKTGTTPNLIRAIERLEICHLMLLYASFEHLLRARAEAAGSALVLPFRPSLSNLIEKLAADAGLSSWGVDEAKFFRTDRNILMHGLTFIPVHSLSEVYGRMVGFLATVR